jgi:hypothetical protein
MGTIISQFKVLNLGMYMRLKVLLSVQNFHLQDIEEKIINQATVYHWELYNTAI